MSLAIECDGPRCENVASAAVPLGGSGPDWSTIRKSLAREGWTSSWSNEHLCNECTAIAVDRLLRRPTP